MAFSISVAAYLAVMENRSCVSMKREEISAMASAAWLYINENM